MMEGADGRCELVMPDETHRIEVCHPLLGLPLSRGKTRFGICCFKPVSGRKELVVHPTGSFILVVEASSCIAVAFPASGGEAPSLLDASSVQT